MSIEYSSNIGKEPPQGGSGDASDLTSGTLSDARLSSGILNATYQHNQYVLTTGTSTAYVATPTVAIVLADGVEILCGIHTTSGASPTLNVSGTGAKAIYKEGAAGLTAVGTGQLLSGPNIYKFTYNSGFNGWVVSSPLFLQAADIPSTLNATTFGSSGVVVGYATNQIYKDSAYYHLALYGGNQGTEGRIFLYGGAHASKPGDIEYLCGSASGAAHSFFDKNGAVALTINEDGINVADRIFCGVIEPYGSGYGLEIRNISNNQSIKTIAGSSNDFANGAGSEYFGHQHATYPGAHMQFAPLSTRAASTAFAVCPVASGDTARVEVQNNIGTTSNGGCLVFIDHNGTVTLKNPYGDATSLFVNSSSPATGEIGIYLSAGVLYCKPAADYTGGSAIKIATFSRIAKA